MPKKIMISGLAAEVLDKLAGMVEEWVIDEINNGRYSESSPYSGSKWITIVDGAHGSTCGQVVSMYYHPTQEHSATTVGSLGSKPSKAFAGDWAVSKQTKALTGNKAMYNTAGTSDWK